METIAKIRRAYFHQKKPIKQICRELKLSRKVVRKVIRSGETEFTYERSVQPIPMLGPRRDGLGRLLEDNARPIVRMEPKNAPMFRSVIPIPAGGLRTDWPPPPPPRSIRSQCGVSRGPRA